MNIICLYCGNAAELVTGAVIYPLRPDLAPLNFWRCAPCGAFVGCHKEGSYRFEDGKKIDHKGTEPMGRLADAELRRAKITAHAAFDPVWKARGMSRRAAYFWLANRLCLPVERAHIGEFDVALCKRVVEVCKEF